MRFAACSRDIHLPRMQTFLAMPPTDATLRVAEEYLENIKNPPKPPLGLTWKDILAEEPFEGQHWEGAYNLPPGSTVEDWDTHSGGSTPSLSPWDDSDDPDESLSSSDSLAPTAEPDELDAAQKSISSSHPRMAFGHRQDVEQLQARQYWRPGWRPDIPISQRFDIGDASTLGELEPIRGRLFHDGTSRSFSTAYFGTKNDAYYSRSRERGESNSEPELG